MKVNSHWLMLLAVVIISACSRNPICGLDGFTSLSTLSVKDSIELEDKALTYLLPKLETIYYAFNTIKGKSVKR